MTSIKRRLRKLEAGVSPPLTEEEEKARKSEILDGIQFMMTESERDELRAIGAEFRALSQLEQDQRKDEFDAELLRRIPRLPELLRIAIRDCDYRRNLRKKEKK